MYGEENIISAVIRVDETTPHLHCDFVPLTGRGIYQSIDRRQRNGTQEKFLEARKKGCLCAKFWYVWSREKYNLTA